MAPTAVDQLTQHWSFCCPKQMARRIGDAFVAISAQIVKHLGAQILESAPEQVTSLLPEQGIARTGKVLAAEVLGASLQCARSY
jgi:hypothetical protein